MTQDLKSLSPSGERGFATLKRVLDAIGWEPEPAESIAGFVVDFGEPHLPIADALAAITIDDRFLFFLNFGFDAPPERRDECARLIARANWGLSIGNFEMDYEDGQLRFKSSVDFAGTELAEPLVRNALVAAMSAVEAYAAALADVIVKGDTAEAAMARVAADTE